MAAPRTERDSLGRRRGPAAALEVPPFGFLAAVAAVLCLAWASLPARFAVHFDVLGRPDRFADRSGIRAFVLIALGFLSASSLVALKRSILSRGMQGSLAGPREAASGAALGLAYAAAALFGAEAARPLLAAAGSGSVAVGALFAFLFAPPIAALASARPSSPPWRSRRRERRTTADASARRLRRAVVLACAIAGAALVLARMP